MTDVTNALKALRPNSSFGVIGDRIKWNDPDNTKPTKKEINNKIDQLKAEADLVLYKDQRLKEYPSIQDCIHAVLDGGDTLTELQAKRAEVKAKYPKPSK